MSTIALASANSPHRGSGEHPELPFVLQFDDTDSPADAIDALLLTEFVTGRQPWSRTEQLAALRAGSSLVPDDATVVRVARFGPKQGTTLAVGNGWTLRAVTWSNGGGQVTVTAVTSALADEVVERVVADCAEPPPTDDRTVVGFWHHHSRMGPQRVVRRLGSREWADIRGNYAPVVAEALDALVAVTPQTISGRLILLHGPPGTGKTTALRALAHAWRAWCQVDCVLDPESLLADVGYLNEVAVGDDEQEGRWRLLILEDCDELIRAEAKQATGQALARLLNLTDGLLGQGRDVLVAITTNEDLARLHPAVTRPGRCLARVEVGRLPSGETLAERLAREAGRESAAVAPIAIGGYL